MAEYTKQEARELINKTHRKWVETCLRQDIRNYMELCPALGEPSETTVMDWATDIYHYKPNGLHNGWAKKLIKRALKAEKLPTNVRETSFVVYSERNIPQVSLYSPKLADITLLIK